MQCSGYPYELKWPYVSIQMTMKTGDDPWMVCKPHYDWVRGGHIGQRDRTSFWQSFVGNNSRWYYSCVILHVRTLHMPWTNPFRWFQPGLLVLSGNHHLTKDSENLITLQHSTHPPRSQEFVVRHWMLIIQYWTENPCTIGCSLQPRFVKLCLEYWIPPMQVLLILSTLSAALFFQRLRSSARLLWLTLFLFLYHTLTNWLFWYAVITRCCSLAPPHSPCFIICLCSSYFTTVVLRIGEHKQWQTLGQFSTAPNIYLK
jgi:hypothetical protein